MQLKKFRFLGKVEQSKSHGFRHRQSQMKFFGGPRFKKAVADAGWKFATKPRDGRIGQFGL